MYPTKVHWAYTIYCWVALTACQALTTPYFPYTLSFNNEMSRTQTFMMETKKLSIWNDFLHMKIKIDLIYFILYYMISFYMYIKLFSSSDSSHSFCSCGFWHIFGNLRNIVQAIFKRNIPLKHHQVNVYKNSLKQYG